MNFKEIASKYGAYAAAAVIFIAMSLIYCSPVLKGKVLTTGDSVQSDSAVHEALKYTEETGDHSWWNGSMFSGMPSYQIGGGEYKSSKFLEPFSKILHRGHWRTEWVFIIYFFCFFILLLSFDINKWLSITGSIAITLSSYFMVIIAAGHNGKTSTIALMSVVLGGLRLIFRKKYGIGVFLTMFFTAMGYSTHPQMSYYILMMIGLVWLGEAWQHIKEKRYKELIAASLLFFGAIGIGVGTSTANVFANKEYAEQTQRGGHSDLAKNDGSEAVNAKGLDLEYATQWSYGIDETMSFMIPGFMGGASAAPVGTDSRLYKGLVKNGIPAKSAKDFCNNTPLYWGEQPFTAGNVYMGAIVCFLFLLGLIVVKGPYKWTLLLATVFSTMLAWGHNCMWLTELFFKYFPLYAKFRAVSSILIVAEIAMPLLGFLAIKDIMDGTVGRDKAARSILTAGGITAVICLFFAAFGGFIFSFVSSNDSGFAGSIPEWLYQLILDERASLLAKDSLRSALFIAASACVMWLWAKDKLKTALMVAILGALIVLDMWPVDRRYFNDRNFVSSKQDKSSFEMLPYEAKLIQDPDIHFRVMNLTVNTFNDARTSYYLKSIGGYCAAKLRRYQDLIDVHLSQMHLPVIGMLNGKYIITEGQDGQAVPRVNPEALGNAWYVNSIKVVDTPDEEINGLMEVNLRNTALTDQSFAKYVKDTSPAVPEDARVWLTKYTPKTLDYICESSADGTIVFSEIYYPFGWKATIDGNPAEYFRANYLLRAMNVPAGRHDIHFEFDPDSVRKGDTISMFFVALMYIITAVLIALGIWRKVKSSR